MTKPPVAIVGNTGRIGLPVRFDFMSTIDLRIPFSRLLADVLPVTICRSIR